MLRYMRTGQNKHYMYLYNVIVHQPRHYIASLLEVFNNNENFLRMCTYTINYYACCVYIYYSKTQCNAILLLCYYYTT